MPTLSVIAYHAVDDGASVLSTPPALFRAQLAAWRRRGFRFLDLDEFETIIRAGPRAWPDRPGLLLCFDDALESVHANALPLLREFDVPAVVFVCTGYVGVENAWPGQPSFVPPLRTMNWDQIADLAGAGIGIGSHSVTHPDLRQLPVDRMRRELVESKSEIERRLGAPVSAFAYPYGYVDPVVRDNVASHYALGFSTTLSPVRAPVEPHDIPRIDAYYLRRRFAYEGLGSRLGQANLAMRRFLRRLRTAL